MMVQSKAVPLPHSQWILVTSLAILALTIGYCVWQEPQMLQLLNPESLPVTMERLGLWAPSSTWPSLRFPL